MNPNDRTFQLGDIVKLEDSTRRFSDRYRMYLADRLFRVVEVRDRENDGLITTTRPWRQNIRIEPLTLNAFVPVRINDLNFGSDRFEKL